MNATSGFHVGRMETDGQSRTILIVGFGAAGLACAEALRRERFEGQIVVLSGEHDLPYDRPPLSKRYLAGESSLADIAIVSTERIRQLRLDVRLGRSAVSLDRHERVVWDNEGDGYRFDDLVVATGVRPRRLAATRGDVAHVLRTRHDADRLRNALTLGSRLAIVGGGLLGLEVAATAATAGIAVLVVEPTERPLCNRVGDELSSRILRRHREQGVEVLCGTGVSSIDFKGQTGQQNRIVGPGERACGADVNTLRLTDGRSRAVDEVLLSIGSIANLEWLEGQGLQTRTGLICDEYCRAAEHVWAVGDVCEWHNLATGAHMRLEHRLNAGVQARTVARNIVGLAEPYVPVPFFWTDQYDLRIQVAGQLLPGNKNEITYGDPDSAFVLTCRDDKGNLIGVASCNAPRELLPYRQELMRAASNAVAEASQRTPERS